MYQIQFAKLWSAGNKDWLIQIDFYNIFVSQETEPVSYQALSNLRALKYCELSAEVTTASQSFSLQNPPD